MKHAHSIVPRELIAALGTGLNFYSVSATAHAAVGDHSALLEGFIHPLTAPEDVLFVLGCGLLIGQAYDTRANAVPLLWLALACGVLLAPWVAPIDWVELVNVGSVLIVGILVALAANVSSAILFFGIAVLSVVHGVANGTGLPTGRSLFEFAIGAAFACSALTFYTSLGVAWVVKAERGWRLIAVRVVGSWLFAIGIIVLAGPLRGI